MRKFSMSIGLIAVALCGVVGTSAVAAQEPGEQVGAAARGGFAGMQRVVGEVTAVTADTATVKVEDGSTYKVATTANTRFLKGQGVPFKMADLKVGDGVMAMGNMDAPNKTLHAAMVFATDAEQVKKLRENLGKTYIGGKVTAIDADNAKMTVLRADGVSQTIAFDETTSFKRAARGQRGVGGGGMTGLMGGAANGGGAVAGESITLADIKVGDNVGGQGSLKGGVFVPAQLVVAAQRPPRAASAATPDGAAGKPQ